MSGAETTARRPWNPPVWDGEDCGACGSELVECSTCGESQCEACDGSDCGACLEPLDGDQ